MKNDQYDLIQILDHIEPAELSYQDWINVGMALQYEGYGPEVWDAWSQRDPARYHTGECRRKWDGFRGSTMSSPVTGGTIVQLARDQGWTPPYDPGHALGWDDAIQEEGVIVDSNWVEGREIDPPEKWDPAQELIRYLEVLFDSTENVGYVTTSFEKDGNICRQRETGAVRPGSSLSNCPTVTEILAVCWGIITPR